MGSVPHIHCSFDLLTSFCNQEIVEAKQTTLLKGWVVSCFHCDAILSINHLIRWSELSSSLHKLPFLNYLGVIWGWCLKPLKLCESKCSKVLCRATTSHSDDLNVNLITIWSLHRRKWRYMGMDQPGWRLVNTSSLHTVTDKLISSCWQISHTCCQGQTCVQGWCSRCCAICVCCDLRTVWSCLTWSKCFSDLISAAHAWGTCIILFCSSQWHVLHVLCWSHSLMWHMIGSEGSVCIKQDIFWNQTNQLDKLDWWYHAPCIHQNHNKPSLT